MLGFQEIDLEDLLARALQSSLSKPQFSAGAIIDNLSTSFASPSTLASALLRAFGLQKIPVAASKSIYYSSRARVDKCTFGQPPWCIRKSKDIRYSRHECHVAGIDYDFFVQLLFRMQSLLQGVVKHHLLCPLHRTSLFGVRHTRFTSLVCRHHWS